MRGRGDGRGAASDDVRRLRRAAMRGTDDVDPGPDDPAPWDLPDPRRARTDADPPAVRWTERVPRVGPWTGSALRGLALLLAATVALVAYWAWSGRPRAVAVPPTVPASAMPVAAPSPVAVPASAAPVATPTAPVVAEVPDPVLVVVHVTGQVARPGVVELPAGSRVADAVAAAGGVTRPRAADTVNLARVLVDGEQIVVGPGAAAARAGPAPDGVAASSPAAVLDLNTADAAGLDTLPGIGPVLAARIVQWRVDNGLFRSVDELGEVSGIGDAILARLRPLVRV